MRRSMTRRTARIFVGLLLVALFVGTLMPGSWKDSALRPLHSPLDLSALAHVVLFAAIALALPHARWWTVRAWHIPALALALALLTEGLQYFAIERHPNLAGVLQDMAGALMGWWVGRRSAARFA